MTSVHLDDVKIVVMDGISPLELKIEIELNEPKQKFLLYAPFYQPAPEDDWLLDIRLYSYTLRADRAFQLVV